MPKAKKTASPPDQEAVIDSPVIIPNLDKKLTNHLIITKSETPLAKWYVIHTYSGQEARVMATLHQRVENLNLTDKIFEVLIPTQEEIQIRQGKKKQVTEKMFPGYMMVRMILDDNSWLAVRTTQGVTGFVGVGNKPTPISDAEVTTIQKYMHMDAPKYKAGLSKGQAVKIVDGPFADFLGTVDVVDEEHGKVRVLISIFSGETPYELDILQVKKI